MGIRRVNNILDRHTYRKEYNRLARMNVPESYVKNCSLYGWYNDDNELLGGYAFAQGNAMAWPKLVGDSLSFLNRIDINRCLEFNLAWARHPLHDQYLDMIMFWLSSGRRIRQFQDIDYVTFAVDASYTSLVRIYEKLASEVLFRGCVEKYPDREVIVFATPVKRFAYLHWIYLPEFMRRLVKHLRRSLKTPRTRPVLQTKQV